MKFKALRYKDTKEFVHIEQLGEEPEIFTSEIPKLQPETATLEAMKEMFEDNDYYEGLELDWERLELVELEMFEANTVGADIRNKLSPPKNLVSLLEVFYEGRIAYATPERQKLHELIIKEMAQTKISVEYIANLL